MRLKTLLTILLLLGTLTGAHAKRLRSMSLEELAKKAQVIVTAQVEAVTEVGGVKVAEATVLQPIAGWKAGTRLTFLAHRTWGCDTSHAIVGETVLLFLSRPERGGRPTILGQFLKAHPQFNTAFRQQFAQTPFYQIVNSGDGRIVIGTSGNTSYIEKPRLKKTLPDFPHPDPRGAGQRRAVHLSDIIKYIHQVRDLPSTAGV